MKVLSVAVFSMPFGFIQTAAGISCGSHCAACWKTGEPGVDIKIGCDGSFVSCHDCPPGYESIHCAKSERCQWVDRSMPLFITILFFSFLACMFFWTSKKPLTPKFIGAKNLIVKYLARVIVESLRFAGRKAAQYRVRVHVQVDFLFFYINVFVLLLECHGRVLLRDL